jgi:N6-adenosine-specific RNA methylase IME4
MEIAHTLRDVKYSVLYADPPWRYRNARAGSSLNGGAESHYPTMSLEAIKSLELLDGRHISEWVAEDAVLFLWTTPPMTMDANEVLDAWGFEYKSYGFVWMKVNDDGHPVMGLGHATRQSAEVCLFAKRGRGVKRVSNSVRSGVISKRGSHSSKPMEVIRRIDMLYGNVPKLELFSREPYQGWDHWGSKDEQGHLFSGGA